MSLQKLRKQVRNGGAAVRFVGGTGMAGPSGRMTEEMQSRRYPLTGT